GGRSTGAAAFSQKIETWLLIRFLPQQALNFLLGDFLEESTTQTPTTWLRRSANDLGQEHKGTFRPRRRDFQFQDRSYLKSSTNNDFDPAAGDIFDLGRPRIDQRPNVTEVADKCPPLQARGRRRRWLRGLGSLGRQRPYAGFLSLNFFLS